MTTIRKTCPSTGCTNPGDPLCHEHMRPYAQKVAEDLETQEKEIAKVKDGKWRAIDPEGPLCQEFMRIVRTAEAPPTLERINLLLFRNKAVTNAYLRKLRARDMVTTFLSGRGSLVVVEVKRDADS